MPASSRKPSLAILGTRGIPARYGGFETFAEQLATGLIGEGVAVTVFCESAASLPDSSYKGVSLIHVKARRIGPARTILLDLVGLWKARRDFDVVYLLGYGAAWGCWLPRLWGTVVWINPDGVEWARPKWGGIARLYFRAMEWCACHFCSRIIADSDSIEKHLRARHKISKPMSVIAYGARPTKTEPSNDYPASLGLTKHGYYLMVCRLEPENHVLEMIRGFTKSKTERSLIILGDHDTGTRYVAELLKQACDRVRFLGTDFDPERLTALRYWAFAYCHGHSVGGTNPSLLEAMACGSATIAHDNPYNREVAGESADYFDTAESFADCVARLEGDTARWASARDAARLRMSAYTWPGIVTAYRQLLLPEEED